MPAKDDSHDPASHHPVRDTVISAAIYAAEAISNVQGLPPHVIPTPTTPAGQPLITHEVRDLAEVKRKQDEDRLFDFSHAVRPQEQAQRGNPDHERKSGR